MCLQVGGCLTVNDTCTWAPGLRICLLARSSRIQEGDVSQEELLGRGSDPVEQWRNGRGGGGRAHVRGRQPTHRESAVDGPGGDIRRGRRRVEHQRRHQLTDRS